MMSQQWSEKWWLFVSNFSFVRLVQWILQWIHVQIWRPCASIMVFVQRDPHWLSRIDHIHILGWVHSEWEQSKDSTWPPLLSSLMWGGQYFHEPVSATYRFLLLLTNRLLRETSVQQSKIEAMNFPQFWASSSSTYHPSPHHDHADVTSIMYTCWQMCAYIVSLLRPVISISLVCLWQSVSSSGLGFPEPGSTGSQDLSWVPEPRHTPEVVRKESVSRSAPLPSRYTVRPHCEIEDRCWRSMVGWTPPFAATWYICYRLILLIQSLQMEMECFHLGSDAFMRSHYIVQQFTYPCVFPLRPTPPICWVYLEGYQAMVDIPLGSS